MNGNHDKERNVLSKEVIHAISVMHTRSFINKMLRMTFDLTNLKI